MVFDEAVMNYLVSEFKKAGINLSNDKVAMQRLKGSRRKGQDRAVRRDLHEHQPAVYHR